MNPRPTHRASDPDLRRDTLPHPHEDPDPEVCPTPKRRESSAPSVVVSEIHFLCRVLCVSRDPEGRPRRPSSRRDRKSCRRPPPTTDLDERVPPTTASVRPTTGPSLSCRDTPRGPCRIPGHMGLSGVLSNENTPQEELVRTISGSSSGFCLAFYGNALYE